MSAYKPEYSEKQKRYKRDHYKRILLLVKKEDYENKLLPAAERSGETISGYIKKAVMERIEREQ